MFFVVAPPEIETPECAGGLKSARAVEAAVSCDEHLEVANHPDANRPMSSFFVRLTAPAHQRRRASARPVANHAEQPDNTA